MDYTAVADQFGITKTMSERIVKFAMAKVREEVMDIGHCWVGRDMYFKRIEKPERTFRNPMTGEQGVAPAKTLMVLRKQMA